LDRAIGQFDLVIRKLPDFSRAYHGRGQAFMADERYELALEDFDKAIELEPEFPFSYLDRGKLYQIQENMEAAIDDWNSVLETANSIRHESLIAEAKDLLASADQ
jgi:tetratricopeptide (TPR) repeat protein